MGASAGSAGLQTSRCCRPSRPPGPRPGPCKGLRLCACAGPLPLLASALPVRVALTLDARRSPPGTRAGRSVDVHAPLPMSPYGLPFPAGR